MAIADSSDPIVINYRYEYVRAADLKIDPAYHVEGRFNEKRAKAMAAKFNTDYAGVITASHRADLLWLIDGNHRRYAAIASGNDYLYAKVFYGLSQQEEAAIFVNLSKAVPLTGMALWVARRIEGDPLVRGVESLLARHGVRITDGTHADPKSVRVPATLERIYRTDNRLLDDTITILLEAWPEQARTLESVPIQAVSSFLWAYRHTDRPPNRKRLVEVLSTRTPVMLIRAARDTGGHAGWRNLNSKSTPGGSPLVWASQREALLLFWNHRLRNPLPSLTYVQILAIGRTNRIVHLETGIEPEKEMPDEAE